MLPIKEDYLAKPWSMGEWSLPQLTRLKLRLRSIKSVYNVKAFQRREILELLFYAEFDRLENYIKTLTKNENSIIS